MRGRRRRQRGERSAAAPHHSRAVVLRRFDAWREAAYDVEAASRRWRTASDDERDRAVWAFFAALEREEKAAVEYERAWRAWSLQPSLSHR